MEHLNASSLLPDTLPFSEGVRIGDMVYLSGCMGTVPGTATLVDGGLEAEARQTMTNIKTVLEANGLAMRNIVKCTVMLADMADWPAFNEIYVSFFDRPYPARSAFGANGLALGGRVEVECIAAIT
ncbi:MAG: Rid family detoxifying hydrolase [Pseudomonadota bacterium]